MTGPYDDILNLPHPVSRRHPQMPMIKRAAQFAPFAALTGYGDVIEESSRYTDSEIYLDESRVEAINEMLVSLEENLQSRPKAHIRYFEPDDRKSGGSYEEADGAVKKIDRLKQVLIMESGTVISLNRIVELSVEGNQL